MNRKQFSLIGVACDGDFFREVQHLIVSGKCEAEAAARLPEVVAFSKERPGQTVDVSVVELVFAPADAGAPIEDADEADLRLFQEHFSKYRTFRFDPAFCCTGDSATHMTDGELWYLPEAPEGDMEAGR